MVVIHYNTLYCIIMLNIVLFTVMAYCIAIILVVKHYNNLYCIIITVMVHFSVAYYNYHGYIIIDIIIIKVHLDIAGELLHM